MPVQFTVLASGSSGNATLLQVGGFGLLLDLGIGPRQLAERLKIFGLSWKHVHAALLTHTHSDHWRDTTLAYLHRQGVPLYCHAEHQAVLETYGQACARLAADNLIRRYDSSKILEIAPRLWCRPFPVRHDGGATFGFRFEILEASQSLAYVTDLGCWDEELARQLADVDLLALEFNHDVGMEYASGRSTFLIARVLSEEGHLSNVQAVELLQEVLRRSRPGRLQHLVQLHLSRDCNHPALAVKAVRANYPESSCGFRLYTASQFQPLRPLLLRRTTSFRLPVVSVPSARGRKSQRWLTQPCLPGMDV